MPSPEPSGPEGTSGGWGGNLDGLPQAAFLLDADGGLLDANSACLELYGLSRQEFLEGGPAGAQGNLVHEDGSPWPQEDFPGTLALRTGHRVTGQVAGLWNPRTRQRVWLELNAVPEFQSGESRPHRALVTLQDQTPQREAAAQLRHSEERLRALTDHAPDHILQLDTLGRIQYLNRVPPGYRAEDVVGHDWLEWMPEAFQGPARAAFERVLLTRKRTDYEVQSPGELRWYHCRLSPMTEGETLVGMVLFSTDITRQKEAEAALRNIALRDEAILANMNEGLLLCAPDGRILLANSAAEAIWRGSGLPLPTTQKEILDSLEWLRCGDRLLPLGASPWGRLLRGQRFTNYEVVLKFKGMARPQEGSYSGVPVLDAGGELLYGILTFRDTTEQNRLEVDRRDLERQFQQTQKLESLGDLAGGVAHDLNNVLGAIMALSSYQEEAATPGTPLHRDLASILKACRRGRTLMQGLLGFARHNPTQERVLDLNALVRDQLELLEGIAPGRVVLRAELDENLSPAQGDPASLGQAIMNLCLNAVEAMPTGGTLSLVTRQVGSRELLLEVRDTGTGMSLDVLARSLDPFFTTKPQGKSTGLGLPMAYGAIQAHRGSLDIHSLPGLGTTVSIRLPAYRPDGVVQPPKASTASAAQTWQDIMVVDDEEPVRASLTQLVGALGYRPIPASSGEEALRILMEGTPVHLVILDLKMPGLGGTATLEGIRRLRPEVPVMLVTGRVDQQAMELCQRYLRVSLLSKPFTLAEFKAHLAQVAGLRH